MRIDDHVAPLIELRRLLNVARAYRLMDEGDRYVAKGDLDNGKDAYRQASDLVPDNHELIFWHALTLAAAGKVDESLPLFSKAFRMWPLWRELIVRMPASGLLPDDPEMMRRILAVK